MVGRVHSIHIATKAADPMISVEVVRASPGRGLEGDRYFQEEGTWSDHPGGDTQLTLIEKEAIDAMGREYEIAVSPGDARRNVVTEGIPLNHLIGKEFRIGEVRVRGIRLCEPCQHLERLTKPGVRRSLIHRGGLRAEILTEGLLHPGDDITVEDD